MSPLIRTILAVVGAMVVAFVIVMLMTSFAANVDWGDPTGPEQLKRALEAGQVPFSGLFLVMAGWLLGAYAGGTTAWRLSRQSGAVYIFTFVFAAVIFINLTTIPHPTWMWLGGMLAAPLMALGGGNRTLSVPRPGM